MIVSLCEAILICLLSVFLTFKTICVKTISNNYMNITITNQIIDFVIDNYTDIKNEQLKALQNDLVDSQELYYFNKQAFDLAIHDIKNQNDFQIDDQTIYNFSMTCIELIEKNLDRKLDNQEQQKIKSLLEKESLWTRFSQNLSRKMTSQSSIVILYILADQWIIKIVLVILILGGFVYILKKGKDLKVICFLMITLLAGLLNYLLLMIVNLLTPLLTNLLNLESLVIVMDPLLYIAMSLLTVNLLFLFGIVIKSYYEY